MGLLFPFKLLRILKGLPMNDRKRLLELVCESVQTDRCVGNCNHPHCNMVQALCEHLISNGVIIPVRCRDCKRWKRNGPKGVCGWCEAWEEMRYHDNFCNFGERKNED